MKFNHPYKIIWLGILGMAIACMSVFNPIELLKEAMATYFGDGTSYEIRRSLTGSTLQFLTATKTYTLEDLATDIGGGSGSFSTDGQGIELIGTQFSLELNGTTLSKSASGLKVADTYDDNFLTTSTLFSGDVTGAYNATVVGNDSHTHGSGTITEADPLALLTAGTDNVKDTHIDWGTGAGQVSTTDMTEGTNLYYTSARVQAETVGGDATGTVGTVAINDDSHAHTSTTISGIDISADTNLAVTAPVVLTGDTLSIPVATSSVDGYLSSANWNTFDNKEPAIATGAVTTYWRGDKSWQTLDKSAVGLSNVENTALSTWAGSTNITTLGTVSTGTVNWANVSKTGSSLADFTTRSAAALSSGNLDIARMPTGGAWALTSDLNIDSNTFFIDYTNNIIGIGLNNPATTDKLSILLAAGQKVFINKGAEGYQALEASGYIAMSNGAFGIETIGANDFTLRRNEIEICRVTATSFKPLGAGSTNLGDGTDYWGDVSYKTLTDRGCLGSFDLGVELQDGTVVSDVEAIKAIKKDPIKKTVYGVPRLDYKTMPKVVYKPAPAKAPDGSDWLIDTEGRKYYHTTVENKKEIRKRYYEDGAETTALISIMLGAIKELSAKQIELENRIVILEGKVP